MGATTTNDRDMRRGDVGFQTERLDVRAATEHDAAFIASLWGDPRVMRFVGFPSGIPGAHAAALRRVRESAGSPLLVAETREERDLVGQCLLASPNADGAAEPDIKLRPAVWRRGYGRELWAALVDQLFLRSACTLVRGTPSVENAASIRMQESVGMKRVGEGVWEFPPEMQSFAVPVRYHVYEITREDWLRRRVGPAHSADLEPDAPASIGR